MLSNKKKLILLTHYENKKIIYKVTILKLLKNKKNDYNLFLLKEVGGEYSIIIFQTLKNKNTYFNYNEKHF